MNRHLIGIVLEFLLDWTTCDELECDVAVLTWVLEHVSASVWGPSLPRLVRLACRDSHRGTEWIQRHFPLYWNDKLTWNGSYSWMAPTDAEPYVKSCLEACVRGNNRDGFDWLMQLSRFEWTCDDMEIHVARAIRLGHLDLARSIEERCVPSEEQRQFTLSYENMLMWQSVCGHGPLASIEYVLDGKMFTDGHDEATARGMAVDSACASGRIDILQTLDKRWQVVAKDGARMGEKACLYRQWPVVEWLLTMISPTVQWLDGVCQSGPLEWVIRLAEHKALANGPINPAELLDRAIRNQDDRVLAYVFGRWGENVAKTDKPICVLVHVLCRVPELLDNESRNDILKTAQTLSIGEQASCMAQFIRHGSLVTAKWWKERIFHGVMADHLDIRLTDVSDSEMFRWQAPQFSFENLFELFERHCCGGADETARLIGSLLDKTDKPKCATWLRRICRHGTEDRITWFLSSMPVQRKDVLDAFPMLVRRNLLNLVKSAMGRFSLSREDVRDIVPRTDTSNSFETLAWLLDTGTIAS